MNLVDLIRKLVRERVDEVRGVVTNIHGAVAGESPPLGSDARQDWLWTRLPGRGLISLEEFLAIFATASGVETEVAVGSGGVTRIDGTQKLHYLRGTLIVPTSSMVPIQVTVSGANAEVAVYVDGTLQRRGVNRIQLNLALDQGSHFIEVLAFSDVAVVKVPAHLRITANLESLAQPTWIDLSTGYLDPSMAVAANTLDWRNDTRAGGWRVMRRTTELLGELIAIGQVSPKGEIPIILSGDFAGFLEVGEELTAGPNTLGTVVSAIYDEAEDDTHVRLRVPLDQGSPSIDWVGRPVGSGRFDELTRIRRGSNTSTVRHIDQNVRVGTIYEYKLQAFGLLDETQTSPWSDIEYIRAGDLEPPGPIVFRKFYPRLEGRRVSCRFVTPADEDYAGVNTYFRPTPAIGTVTSATLNSVTDASQNWAPGQFVNYQLHIFSGGVMTDDVFAFVFSSDMTTLYTSGDMPWVPSGGADFELYYERPVLTDFGKPLSEDQFSFDAIRNVAGELELGTYIFRTFDFVGNEQLGSGEQSWVFSGVTSPRTLVHFESRDPKGRVSATQVRAYFTVTPAIQLVESGNITWVSGDQIEDSDIPRVSGDFADTPTDHHFIWVYPSQSGATFQSFSKSNQPFIRRIVASEVPNRLYLDQTLPTTGARFVQSGDRYEIYDGATFAHIGLSRVSSLSELLPISGPIDFTRASGTDAGKWVEFYSVVHSLPIEELQGTFVDNDTIAEIGQLILSEPQPNILEVKITDTDDDVWSWRSYAKKSLTDVYSGGWPTTTGRIDGPFDELYLRWADSIQSGKQYRHTAGDGCWYVIVVGVDSVGNDGPRVGCVKRIGAGSECTGFCSGDMVFYDYGAEEFDPTAGYGANRIFWKFTSLGTTPERLSVRLYGIELEDSRSIVSELTYDYRQAHTQRYVDLALGGTSDWLNEPGDSVVAANGGIAYFVHSGTMRHMPRHLHPGDTGGEPRTWVYTLEARDGVGTIIDTAEFSYTGYYDVPDFADAVQKPVLQNVVAVNAYPGHNSVLCDDPYTNRVSWEITPASTPYDSDHTIDVYAINNIGGGEIKIASGLPLRAYTDWYHAFAGQVTHWSCTQPENMLFSYRVELRSFNKLKQAITSNLVAGLVYRCDGVVDTSCGALP